MIQVDIKKVLLNRLKYKQQPIFILLLKFHKPENPTKLKNYQNHQ